MVRSNPIGLAEPSQRRDGYAVGGLSGGGVLRRHREESAGEHLAAVRLVSGDEATTNGDLAARGLPRNAAEVPDGHRRRDEKRPSSGELKKRLKDSTVGQVG